MKNLEKNIIEDILNNKDFINEIDIAKQDNFIFIHYTLGAYIRNKYLWKNPYNFNKLSSLYGLDNIDNISKVLVDKIIKKSSYDD